MLYSTIEPLCRVLLPLRFSNLLKYNPRPSGLKSTQGGSPQELSECQRYELFIGNFRFYTEVQVDGMLADYEVHPAISFIYGKLSFLKSRYVEEEVWRSYQGL